MNRLDKFRALEKHPWYGTTYKKLKPDHRARCETFITAHLDETAEEFRARAVMVGVGESNTPALRAMSDLLLAVCN